MKGGHDHETLMNERRRRTNDPSSLFYMIFVSTDSKESAELGISVTSFSTDSVENLYRAI